jgi:hypothetical protein
MQENMSKNMQHIFNNEMTIRQVIVSFLEPHQYKQLMTHLAFYLNEIIVFFELKVKFKVIILNHPGLGGAELVEHILLLLEANNIDWKVFCDTAKKQIKFGTITENLLNEAEKNRLHFVHKEPKIHIILRIPR